MDIEREIKVRDAIKYCIENFDSKTATNRIIKFWNDELELQQKQYVIDGVSISLRDKLEDFVAKYWYDNEYQHIDKQDHAKATESRDKFRKWFSDNIDAFLKQ